MGFLERVKSGWNAFLGRDPTKYLPFMQYGTSGYGGRPDRVHFTRGNERSIVTSIYNRIAIDVASVTIGHVKLDENDRFLETINSTLNDCLTFEANKDQTGRAFMQDVVMSLLDEGCIAIMPTYTNTSPYISDSYKILAMRTAKILAWYPDYVRLKCYNDQTGRQEELVMPKRLVCIIENPLYSIINEPNSTMQRLIHKLALLDITDEQTASGKLDLIIQLPYIIKTDARKQQAEQRRKTIEDQLAGSKYGIAYTDGTEHITQLNRAVENQLLSQIQYLTDQVLAQLGLTTEILNGTADEKAMLNYNNRIIEPIISAIVDEMNRKFLTKTARTQRQRIMFFNDPFKLVPTMQLAEIADKLTANEIMSSNEIRQIIGLKPSDDPNADMLLNKNINPTGQMLPREEDVADDGMAYEDPDELGGDMPASYLMNGGEQNV